MMNLKKRFLDIAKAFDKVWYQGIFFKLRLNGIWGDLLNMCYFLSQRIKWSNSMVKLLNWQTLSQKFPSGLS